MTVIAEGIETALSVAVACPEFQVLSAVSLSNMAAVALPDTLKDIIIAADNDSGNEKARRALEAALKKFASQGRTVRLAMPEIVHGDWNDVLREKTQTGSQSGRSDIRKGIENAKVVQFPEANQGSAKAQEVSEDRRFIYRDDGIWRRNGDGAPFSSVGPSRCWGIT